MSSVSIDLAFRKVTHKYQISIPKEWVDDFGKQRLFMYSEEKKEQAVLLPEVIYKELKIKPLVLIIPKIYKKNNFLTLQKDIREKLNIQVNDIIRLTYNKKLSIIVLVKVKTEKIKNEFDQEFVELAQKFFSDPIVQNNIKLIKKIEKQEKERIEKK